MSFSCLKCVLPLILVFKIDRVQAFDPVTAAMAAQSAQGLMEKAEDAASLGFSLTELLDELGIDTGADNEIEAGMQKLYSINRNFRDFKHGSETVQRALDQEMLKGKNLNQRIKALRDAIRASKQIAAIFGVRQKAGEKAIRVQEIKINTMMLEELQGIRRAQFLEYLENKQAKLQREAYLKEILETEKSRRSRPKS